MIIDSGSTVLKGGTGAPHSQSAECPQRTATGVVTGLTEDHMTFDPIANDRTVNTPCIILFQAAQETAVN